MRYASVKVSHPVGATVQSRYRAPWTGVVLEHVMSGGGRGYEHIIARVQVTHDRNGTPVRKPSRACWVRTLDCAWLRVLALPVRTS